jgi:hypothetical protein
MRGRPALTAAVAVVVLAVGQVAAFAHAAGSRHVTCDAHGEEIEAPILDGAIDHCDQTHFVGLQGRGGEHQDCAIARMLRQSSHAPRSAPAIAVTTIMATAAPPPVTRGIPVLDLVLIAPKTSPPA